MRRLSSALAVVAAVPVLLAVPVATRPAPAPHPVAPHVSAFTLTPRPALTGVVADSGERGTARFDLVGATLARRDAGTLARADIEVRTRGAGQWSGWTRLSLPDGGPDGGSADARAAASRPTVATEPVWVGPADGVQARVVDRQGRSGPAPASLRIVLVDGGTSSADVDPGSPQPLGDMAAAAESQPKIYTRAQWGADESLRLGACPSGPDYAPTIKMGFIHHTDGSNGYTSGEVPSIIRSIYAYHVNGNGWCDVGYNFLVDRFGRIWEGRYGGIDRPVVGAHTGGFNYDTFAASLIGNFSSVAPPSAMLAAVEKLFAWKFGSYYLDPLGTATVTAGSFSGSRYADGDTVRFKSVSGHRDADYTTCPGDVAYSDLPTVRSGIRSAMGAGLVAPSASTATIQMASGQSVAVHAGVVIAQKWTLTVSDAGGTVRTIAGNAYRSTPINTTWDGTDDHGAPVQPGSYTLTLTSTNKSTGAAAVPFSSTVTVTPPVTISGPSRAPYDGIVKLHGHGVPGAAVRLALRNGITGATTTPTVTVNKYGTWSTSFTADSNYGWTASLAGYRTPRHWTKVQPLVAAPAVPADRTFFVAKGSALDLTGTALAGANVALVVRPDGATASTTLPPVPVAPDGTWSASYTPTALTTFTLDDDHGVSSPTYTVYPVGKPTVVAPDSGYSGRSVTVTGDAGDAPVAVRLFVKNPGATSFTRVGTTVADASGGYTATLPLPDVTATTSVPVKVMTTFGRGYDTVSVQPTFPPTMTAPATSLYGGVRAVSGTAVPGDRVGVWTEPLNGTTWTRAAVATAAADGSWSSTITVTRDIRWRAKSLSGTSAAGRTVVVPGLRLPRTVTAGALVTPHGTTVPGAKVTVYLRRHGTTTWKLVRTGTANRYGRWTVDGFKVWHAVDIQAFARGYATRVRLVTVA